MRGVWRSVAVGARERAERHLKGESRRFRRVDSLTDPTAAARTLAESRRIVFFTGAGLSTESGIPDFRSEGGIWTRFDPGEFQYDRLLVDPARFWRLRAKLMEALDLERVEPNAAHRAIAEAEESGRVHGVITQNIDGLHQRAGTSPEKLVEIHGSASRVRCLECDAWFPYEVARQEVEAGRVPPPCPACGGVLKPGTVLFGERLPEVAMERAANMTRTCDAFVVIGSSLSVWPAAGYPADAVRRGARLLIVNRDPTPFDTEAHHVLRGSAGEVVPRVLGEAGLLDDA